MWAGLGTRARSAAVARRALRHAAEQARASAVAGLASVEPAEQGAQAPWAPQGPEQASAGRARTTLATRLPYRLGVTCAGAPCR